jgi:hypothetical protein
MAIDTHTTDATLKKNPLFLLLLAVVVVLVLILLLLGWYLIDGRGGKRSTELAPPDFSFSASEPQKGIEQNNTTKSEADMVVEKVSKHMLLPETRMEVMTVTDAELLRGRDPFVFQFIKNGDKILAYDKGFIIYDMEQDKIVDAIRFPMQLPSLTPVTE